MRAVWSFWTRPHQGYRAGSWGSERNHLLAWILSVETARAHYPHTSLVTDDAGARMLVDGLGLPFASVSTRLNALERHDPSWWALGKLVAYREQSEPFVHLDTDVFLWKRLPERLERAPVFAQNPERVDGQSTFYRPQAVEEALGRAGGGWIPEEWAWFADARPIREAACCGIVGGTLVDFIRHYAEQALRLVEHPANQPGLRSLTDRREHTVSLEQYLLGACVAYHQGRPWSRFREVRIEYLFPTWGAAFVEGNAARAGFTHLMCEAKRDPKIMARIEARVRRDYPERYERCLAYLGEKARPEAVLAPC